MNIELWESVLSLEQEARRRDKRLSRSLLQDYLEITESEARCIMWSLKHRDIIKLKSNITLPAHKDALFLYDLHFPFQDDLFIETVLSQYDIKHPDYIILGGDILDFYKISRYVKKPNKMTVGEEIKVCRSFLEELSKRFPKSKIIYKEGNHEQRLENYILEKCEDLYDILQNILIQKLGLKKLNIQYVKRPFKIGEQWVLHGHEKQGCGGRNPVDSMWRFIHDNFVMGHAHKNQTRIYPRITGQKYIGISVGYGAGYMEYAMLNDWNQAFLFEEFSKNGEFRHSLKTVIDGKIY